MKRPQRKLPRLRGYDYSGQGAYFITVCTAGHQCLLSHIVVGSDPQIAPKVVLTEMGQIVEQFIKTMPGMDRYVIMPNHIHLILLKTPDQNTSLSSDIRSMKGLVTKKIGYSIWQSSFYDHIIRDEADYVVRANYLEENPLKWALDKYYRER